MYFVISLSYLLALLIITAIFMSALILSPLIVIIFMAVIVPFKLGEFGRAEQHFLKMRMNNLTKTWSDRVLTRSPRFLIRALYYHGLKGATMIHGLGGFISLLSGLIEVFYYFPIVNNAHSSNNLRIIFLIANVAMTIGMITPHMLSKLQRMGYRRYFFLRHLAEALSFVFLANSIYANEGSFSSFKNASTLSCVCTLLYYVTQMIPPIIILFELRYNMVWLSPNLVVPQVFTTILLLSPVSVHIILGTNKVDELYRNTKFGEYIYFLSTLTSVCVSFDIMMSTLVLRKVLTVEQHQRHGLILWPMFWNIAAVTSSIILVNMKLGGYLVLSFGFSAWFGKRMTPESVFTSLAKNQLDLYALER